MRVVALALALLPSVVSAKVIDGVWWPTSAQTGYREAYGHLPDGITHADREWFYGAPGDARGTDNATQLMILHLKNSKPAIDPSIFAGEMGSGFWCTGTIGSRWTNYHALPDPLGDAVGKRTRDLVKWGVKPGESIMVAPYLFACKANLSDAQLRALADDVGVTLPPGYRPRPSNPVEPCSPDYPDRVSVRLDGACFRRWLSVVRLQHPEVGLVIAQISNGGNAYGRDGRGLAIARYVADAQRTLGYPVAIQIEDRNAQRSGAKDFWSAPPSADCKALRSATRQKARLSIFWGWGLQSIESDLEACRR